jgi:hypothetical protein
MLSVLRPFVAGVLEGVLESELDGGFEDAIDVGFGVVPTVLLDADVFVLDVILVVVPALVPPRPIASS